MRRDSPLWLKLAYTAFAAAIVPVYVRQYGWRNFLDVALHSVLSAPTRSRATLQNSFGAFERATSIRRQALSRAIDEVLNHPDAGP